MNNQTTLTNLATFALLALAVVVFVTIRNRTGIVLSDEDKANSPRTCLGPPFIYVSVHDKVSNILKYSRNGCLVDDSVLIMSEAYEKISHVEFRSLAIGKSKDHNALFVASASKSNSRLLIFGKCVDEKDDYLMRNKRHFIEVVAEQSFNPGLDHSYGVCHDSSGNVYISNQHTDCVLRFAVNTWEPMPLPQSLQLKRRMNYFDGTFVQFGLPNMHVRGNRGVRSIAHVGEHIWIAHESMSGVVIADVETGQITDFIVVDTPIGLYHHRELNLTFVSCKSKVRGGVVYAIDVNTFVIKKSYYHRHMVHPSGMTAYVDILYVAEQTLGAILSFDIQSEAYLGKIVEERWLVDEIEQLALSPC